MRGGAPQRPSASLLAAKMSVRPRGGPWRWLDLSTVTKAGAARERQYIPRFLARENSSGSERSRCCARLGCFRGRCRCAANAGRRSDGETVVSRELGCAMELGAAREFPQIQGDHRWGLKGWSPGKLRETLVRTIRRCESSCRHRHTEQRVRLPRLARHERGEGWGEGRSNLASRLAIAKRLLSPALSSVLRTP